MGWTRASPAVTLGIQRERLSTAYMNDSEASPAYGSVARGLVNTITTQQALPASTTGRCFDLPRLARSSTVYDGVFE